MDRNLQVNYFYFFDSLDVKYLLLQYAQYALESKGMFYT